jgi:hypothetical protein
LQNVGKIDYNQAHQTNKETNMNTATQAQQYSADLEQARKELVAVQVFDRTFLRQSRIESFMDRINTLEMLVSLCEAEDAQIVEDLADVA